MFLRNSLLMGLRGTAVDGANPRILFMTKAWPRVERRREMTSRERLLRTFRHEKPDRVPIAPFLYYNDVYEKFKYKTTNSQLLRSGVISTPFRNDRLLR